MRAREIIGRPLTENVFKTMAQDFKGAVAEPFQKLQAIGSTPGAWTNPGIAARALDQRERAAAMQDISQRQQQKQARIVQQTQQRAKDLAQQWVQQVKTQTPAQPAAPAATSRAAPLPTITVGGKLLTKGPDGLWHDETGAAVQDTAQAAKIDKAYQDQEYRKKQFQQTAMVKEIASNPAQTAAKRAKRAQARKGVAAPSATAPNDPSGFVAWSDEKLRDTIPGTRTEINMDKVRKDTALYQPVKAALDRVLKNPNNAVAVQDYFEAAMYAMQQLSAQIKQSSSSYGGLAGGSSSSTGGLLGRFMSSDRVQDLQQAAKDPVMATQIKKELGIR